MKSVDQTADLPLVSVILPVYNEADAVTQTIEAVVKGDYPRDRLELIVADGVSTDGTRETIIHLQRQYPDHQILLLDNPNRIFSTGFNAGVSASRGQVIVMLGGHTEVAPDYLRRCVEQLQKRPEIDCVGGFVETVAQTRSSRAIAAAMSSPFGVGGVAFRTRPNLSKEVDTVAFGAYRRSTLDRCGPLDEELVRNQDDEYNYRLREMGGRILLAADIRSRYRSRSSLSSVWRQYFRYGFWKVRVMQKHPRQMRLRHFVPPLFLGSLVAEIGLAPWIPTIRLLLVAEATAYGLASLAASTRSASKTGWGLLPMLPPAFGALHFGYGLGFLLGLIRFSTSWGRPEKRGSWATPLVDHRRRSVQDSCGASHAGLCREG